MMSHDPITPEQYAQLAKAILGEALHRPPTIVVIGTSGAGKSSLINRLFKTHFALVRCVRRNAANSRPVDSDLAINRIPTIARS